MLPTGLRITATLLGKEQLTKSVQIYCVARSFGGVFLPEREQSLRLIHNVVHLLRYDCRAAVDQCAYALFHVVQVLPAGLVESPLPRAEDRVCRGYLWRSRVSTTGELLTLGRSGCKRQEQMRSM